jgi:hypothetical protein
LTHLATRHARSGDIFGASIYTEAGGLMSYGTSLTDGSVKFQIPWIFAHAHDRKPPVSSPAGLGAVIGGQRASSAHAGGLAQKVVLVLVF